MHYDDDVTQAVTAQLEALTRAEKEAVALGAWTSVPNVTAHEYSDGGNGIRDAEGATAFPSTLALAASFDVDLALRYGRILAQETRFAGRNVLLGPVLDVARVPWDGRTGEGLGEDPELAAQIGGAIIAGVQSQRVLPIVKHLVANNAELGRTGSGPFAERSDAVDVVVDDAALREVYLKPFHRAVTKYGAAGLMSSYNRLGGEYPAQSAKLWAIVRDEWGFEGVTLPDFLFAVRDDAAALAAGLDLPGLGPAHRRTPDMVATLDDAALDTIVRHVLWAAAAVDLAPAEPRRKSLGSGDALAAAEEIAIAGTVLLANSGVLPLSTGSRVALVVPESLDHLAIIGGSAAVSLDPVRRSDLAASLREHGVAVDELRVAAADVPLPAVALPAISATVTVGESVETRALPTFAIASDEVGADTWSADVTSVFIAPSSGAYRITVTFAGRATLFVDGEPVVSGFREASPMIAGPEYPLHHTVDLREGQRLALRLDFESDAAIVVPGTPIAPGFRLGIAPLDDHAALAMAVATADAAVVVLGRASGEAMDVESLELPEDQVRLLAALVAAQPNTVLVTMGSGPLVLPDTAARAILHAWQAGERAGSAVAAVLSGAREPGGRLPLTFPASEEQVPLSTAGYPGVGNAATYSEGVEVGYRGYAAAGATPRFPFGHGLGYAAIELEHVTIVAENASVVARGVARNTSTRSGVLVAQLYARRPGAATSTLAGFARVEVSGRATADVEVTVALDDLAGWTSDGWRVAPGDYGFTLGLSSADARNLETVTIG